MATVDRILIIFAVILLFNRIAFSKKKSFHSSLYKHMKSKGSKHVKNGYKKATAPQAQQPTTVSGGENKESSNLIMAALYGGLGLGIPSAENFDYANGLNTKIQSANGYGIPPGIYSYAFDPTTGMPFVCDPTKTPPGGVSQANSVAQQPPVVNPPVKTPPAGSPPAATVAQSRPFLADKVTSGMADTEKNTAGIPVENKNTGGIAIQDKNTQKQQKVNKAGYKNFGLQYGAETFSPTDDTSGSLSDSQKFKPKTGKNYDGQTPTPPSNAPTFPMKEGQQKIQDEDIMLSQSQSDPMKSNGMNNNLGNDQPKPTPSLTPPSNTQPQMASPVGTKGNGASNNGPNLSGPQNAASGSSVGVPVQHKLPENRLTPLIHNDQQPIKPATPSKSSNSLTKLIKGNKYKTVKRKVISIKLPDIPPCPNMQQYHWPWNCLGNGKITTKKECIESLQNAIDYADYPSPLPYYYKR